MSHQLSTSIPRVTSTWTTCFSGSTCRMEFRRSYFSLFFMLLFLWLNTRPVEVERDVEEDIGFFSPIKDLIRPVLTTSYPRNASDWYQGTWQLHGNRTQQLKSWPKVDNGAISISISLTNSPSNDIALLKGYIELFEGEYVTDQLARWETQGIYFAATGALFLVVSPDMDPQSVDQTLVLPANKSYTASELWDMQIDGAKFATNPFSGEATSSVEPRDVELSMMFRPSPRTTLGMCPFIVISQLDSKEHSRERTPQLRRWRVDRATPFSTTDDLNTFEELDEERLVYYMRGYMVSSSCGLMLEVQNTTRSGDLDAMVSTGQVFAFLSAGCLAVLSYCMLSHIETHSANAALMKVSPWSVLLSLCADILFTVFHLVLGASYHPLSRPFYFIFFCSAVLNAFFQAHYVLSVLRVVWTSATPTSHLSRIYMFLYAYLIASISIAFFYEPLLVLPLTIAHSSWIPQIVHNAKTRTRFAFSWKHVLAITACRIIIPAYFYILSPNFLHIRPRPGFILFLVLYQMAQIAILLAQDRFGPRFFIPTWMMSPPYNYHRPIPDELLTFSSSQTTTTSQSMDETDDTTLATSSTQPQQLQQQVVGPTCAICLTEVNPFTTEHMIAPCNHTFHETCLHRWMEEKIECPVCRRALPMPPELDREEQELQHRNARGGIV